MRGAKHYLAGLSTLHELEGAEQARPVFRQSMATLAEAAREPQGVPLEGLDPERLLASVRRALSENWLDDLSFLSPSAAACALYGLASALPHGAEQRELGRRVLARLHDGDAATFVALAAAVALGSTRAFEDAAMGARVGLSLVLPIGTGPSADALALTLVSRPELCQRWVVEPSTGALPARRTAARLLERAAREAARRAVQGDDASLALFDIHPVHTAWSHLMADREPLVWRHVATGRGLLSTVVPRFFEEVARDLAAERSFARNRRGAASLAACVALKPEASLARAREVLEGPMLARDPGVASAMIYGLPRAAEVEPEVAEQLLRRAVERGGALAAEALLDLRREWFGTNFGAKAGEVARVALRQRYGSRTDDDGQAALIDLLCEELGELGAERAPNLPDAVFAALVAFANRGAREAYDLALQALAMAQERVSRLTTTVEDEGPQARQDIFRVLHELDVGLCESSALYDLLCLGAQSGVETAKTTAPLTALMAQLADILVEREAAPHRGGELVPHLTLRMRRLRTLLHLLDTDLRSSHERTGEVRSRRLEHVRALFSRVEQDNSSAMDRIVHAALARGADSLVREEVLELSDVLLAAAAHVTTHEGFAALSEGSMLPEAKQGFKALAVLAATLESSAMDSHSLRAVVGAVEGLSRAIMPVTSARSEGLRLALARLARALARVMAVRALRELSQERPVMEQLALAIDQLAELYVGARRRFARAHGDGPPTSGEGVSALATAVERVVAEGDRVGLELALESLAESVRAELPPPLSQALMRVLRPLLRRPLDTSLAAVSERPPVSQPLPAWLPPSRTLGGFYVLRALGAGAGGSVFVVKRIEERHDPDASAFALKVPEYDGSAARSLSEEEFLRMFRQEAGAMLAVPPHRNLASFVTFDAGARPKPILVMELVEGMTLERVLAKRDLDMPRALRVIDGILCGLTAMHSVGVGHLDVKPSNVIMREGGGAAVEPVLVDFGLSGRHVRPGCATGNYGAPEIWGLIPQGAIMAPSAVDVYALGCVAYEVLCGHALFDSPNEMATLAAHVSHDGQPPPVEALVRRRETRPVAEWLVSCLRRDPRERASVAQLRKSLRALGPSVEGLAWPLTAEGPQQHKAQDSKTAS